MAFRRLVWIHVVFILAMVAGCAQNPVTGKRELVLVSESEEVRLGAEGYVPGQQQSGGQYILDPELNAYISEVGQSLAAVSDRPNLPYEFVVLNESVPNAWAMPGGKIAINRGLLVQLENEAELAAVLSHEIVHAAARHGAQSQERGMLLQAGLLGVGFAVSDTQYSGMAVGAAALGANLINTRYGRDDESEADFYGMKYMAKAGYDTGAAVTLQEKFVALSGGEGPAASWIEGLFASHPPSPERVRANQASLRQFPAGGRVGGERYRQKIAKLQQTAPAYELYGKGLEALREEQPERALGFARAALEIEPREAIFYGLRGDGYFQMEAYPQALAAYDEAIKHNDEFYKFYLQRGLVQQRLGNARAAQRDLERSNQLMPSAVAHFSLGEMALAANQRDAAMGHFRAASSSQSALGKRAASQLARMDIGTNPDRYITVEGTGDATGHIVVHVHNKAPFPVADVRLDVELVYRGRRILGRDSLSLRGPIPPGGVERVRSSLRVPTLEQKSLQLRSQVVSVEAVR